VPKPEKWNLDDGPAWDLRESATMLRAYEGAVDRAQAFYPYSAWKRVDWAAVKASGLANAKLADEKGDASYLHLAVAQLVASIPDGHVQLEYDDDDPAKDCAGPRAHITAARLKYEHIGGGFGLTISGLDSGEAPMRSCPPCIVTLPPLTFVVEVIITSVVPGSQADAAGLLAGHVVDAIDGVDSVSRVTAQGAAGWLWVNQCCSNPATKRCNR
jgi:hypothetical protein